MYLPPLTKKSFNHCFACFYPQGLYAPQRHLYLHLGDAFNCHLALSWLNNKAQAEGDAVRFNEALCERRLLCRHHQRLLPEFTSSGPEWSCGGIWQAEGAHTVSSPSCRGTGGFSGISSSHCAWLGGRKLKVEVVTDAAPQSKVRRKQCGIVMLKRPSSGGQRTERHV